MKLQNKLSKVVLLMVVFGLVLAAGAVAGGTTGAAVAEPEIFYSVHQQDAGWLGYVSNGEDGGKTGIAKRIESIKIRVVSPAIKGGVKYEVHQAQAGWLGPYYDNDEAGLTGAARQLEAIKVELTGDLAKTYTVRYRVHQQDIGWSGWAENGAESGTTGQAKRIESIQVRLVKK
jgi:uncharacterized protein YjdB